MQLTKYEHACFTLQKDGKLLIVDPGVLTTSLSAPENVVGVVVTHAHSDHFDASALGGIIAHNPDALIMAPASVTAEIGDNLPTRTVQAGDSLELGPFQLGFSGGQHAVIHDSLEPLENVAVTIDDTVFYPGDSFSQPPQAAEVVALPVTAPWLQISQVIDYLTATQPELVFPTHDAIASADGQAIVDNMLQSTAQSVGSQYQRLKVGDSLDC